MAGFMSGSGTNLSKLIELQRALEKEHGQSPFEVAFIYSDRSDGTSRGEAIALDAGVPYFSYDVRKFHELKHERRTTLTPRGMELRREYDRVPAALVKAFNVDVIALGGYMSVTTLDRCVNVHPADLSLLDEEGSRRFVGDDAVLDAIKAGRTELRASTLWTDLGVDSGPLLMISRPLEVELPAPLDELVQDEARLRRVADEHQERLKAVGDWEIFPANHPHDRSGQVRAGRKPGSVGRRKTGKVWLSPLRG